jgi:hypothetical protein
MSTPLTYEQKLLALKTDLDEKSKQLQALSDEIEGLESELSYHTRFKNPDFYPKGTYINFAPELVLKLIDTGDIDLLNHSFSWKDTPQGSTYWDKRRTKTVPITDEDKITLLRWCVNYYRDN